MNTEILELLQQNNRTQSWDEVRERFKPMIAKEVNGEPVYEFFEALKDKSLKRNGQLISISTQPINSFVPYHIHNYVEIMVVLLGHCIVRTPTEEIPMKQDEIIIMGNKTIHKVEPISNGTIVINIAMKKAAFSLNDLDFLTHSPNAKSVSSLMFSLLSSTNSHGAFNLFHTKHDPHVVNTIYDIISEYYRPDSQSNQIIRLEILELLVRLVRGAGKNPVLQVQKSAQNVNEIDTLTLLLYIEKNFRTANLDQMAKHFGFNPNYLSSYLKKKTGYTFIKLVHIQRINTAAEYLAFTNAPIDKISLEVGYENPSYFYKVFKKFIGCSPAEYRKQAIKG
ncbi:AraC-like DNA-binding protein/mannose-6-phosphate isomerase-like protein (cupin superfamily) [Lactobacillus colini]|uniref:AraC-like DNA-binding protein/mannose-6-phosphate isomerase-like protein (Cupin superfamily) n=1 Tax=Lactobacillus colini TaxID=1819254 RepID=A0ABS4MEY1_9LACO|nr:AraC family transcriptional regulator [Lactobacillus colini]MBP2058250.1 AraC-like DNA-binding protein/mannose-6-phosphate isomerase-like protein (cupin superfamily) [Lactobacillus colini]